MPSSGLTTPSEPSYHQIPVSAHQDARPKIAFNAENPLEAILPRDLMLQIVILFFHYLYPLIPLIHRPSFESDIDARREEREGETEWTTLVIAIIASTAAQMPSILVPLENAHCQALIRRCYAEANKRSQDSYSSPTSTRCKLSYALHKIKAH